MGADNAYTPVLSPQLLQQCLRLLEVGRVKPLGEPAVDRCQQLVGFCALALLLPQASQAHSSAQFQGFGLLAAGDVEGLTKTPPGFRHLWLRALCRGSYASLEQQLAFEPIELRLVAPLPRAVHQRQRLVQHLLSFVILALLPVCPGQKGQRVGLACLCPGRPVCRKALPYLPYALLVSSLLDQ